MDLPSGWEGAIFVYGAAATDGAIARPILHAGNFALPVDYSGFGTGIVQQIAPGDVFAAVCEYDPNSAAAPLFASPRRPSNLSLADFNTATLAIAFPGQMGYQQFFNSNGRAFSFYAVLGIQSDMSGQVSALNSVLATLSIGPGNSSYYVTSAASAEAAAVETS